MKVPQPLVMDGFMFLIENLMEECACTRLSMTSVTNTGLHH